MSNNMHDADSDSTGSGGMSGSNHVFPSPYQRAEPPAESEGLMFNDVNNNETHRRKNILPQHHHPKEYSRHLSFEEEYRVHHAGPMSFHHLMKKKGAVIVAVSVVVLLLSLIVFTRHHEKTAITPSSAVPDADNMIKEDFILDSCGEFFEPDRIMALKNSSTVENIQNGAVAADMGLCSEVGLEILRDDNGNAVDAAVATALCLGVVNPASSGMGGGGMILVHSDMASHKTKIGHAANNPPTFHDDRDVKPAIWESSYYASTSSNEDNNDPTHHRKTTTTTDDGVQSVDTTKVTEFIDCREEAPTGATRDMFKAEGVSSTDGGLAIAVPGELRGLELAHSRHGQLEWRKVVEPAMKLARDGFPVNAYLAHELEINKQKILAQEHLGKLLTKNNDGATLLKEGEVLKQPLLATTLRAVMDGGADAIYKGDLAEKIAQDIQDAGGIITAEDLANYRPALRSPVVARDVNGFNMVGVGPPSSGGAAVIGAARFLSGYANPFAFLEDTLSKHRLVEATRNVFSIRMSLSDPAFNTNVTLAAVADLVRGPYMERLRRQTRDTEPTPLSLCGGDKWAMLSDDEGQGTSDVTDAKEGDRRKLGRFGYLEDHGTTHLSVIDKDRNAVSITSTVNTYFGSKVVSPSSGIVLNNQMDDFATPGKPNHFGLHPSKANYIVPRKRPLSSMSPTMVFKPHEGDDRNLGDIFLVLGASGGPKIISAVLQTFLNFAMLGMPLFESVASPRVHDQLLYHGTAKTVWERAPILKGPTIEVTPRTVAALQSRGHSLLPVDYMGTVQAVGVDLETGKLTAVSDIRKGGKPAGY